MGDQEKKGQSVSVMGSNTGYRNVVGCPAAKSTVACNLCILGNSYEFKNVEFVYYTSCFPSFIPVPVAACYVAVACSMCFKILLSSFSAGEGLF